MTKKKTEITVKYAEMPLELRQKKELAIQALVEKSKNINHIPANIIQDVVSHVSNMHELEKGLKKTMKMWKKWFKKLDLESNNEKARLAFLRDYVGVVFKNRENKNEITKKLGKTSQEIYEKFEKIHDVLKNDEKLDVSDFENKKDVKKKKKNSDAPKYIKAKRAEPKDKKVKNLEDVEVKKESPKLVPKPKVQKKSATPRKVISAEEGAKINELLSKDAENSSSKSKLVPKPVPLSEKVKKMSEKAPVRKKVEPLKEGNSHKLVVDDVVISNNLTLDEFRLMQSLVNSGEVDNMTIEKFEESLNELTNGVHPTSTKMMRAIYQLLKTLPEYKEDFAKRYQYKSFNQRMLMKLLGWKA